MPDFNLPENFKPKSEEEIRELLNNRRRYNPDSQYVRRGRGRRLPKIKKLVPPEQLGRPNEGPPPKARKKPPEKHPFKTQPQKRSPFSYKDKKEFWYENFFKKGFYVPFKEFAIGNYTRGVPEKYDWTDLWQELHKELKDEDESWSNRKVINYLNHLLISKEWFVLLTLLNENTFADAISSIADVLRYSQIEGFLDPTHQTKAFERVQNIKLLDLPFDEDAAKEIYDLSPEALYETRDDKRSIYQKVFRKHKKKYESYDDIFKSIPKERAKGQRKPRPANLSTEKDDSLHELVVNDIFTLCGIPFESQLPFKPQTLGWIIDYKINGRYFEIFGMNTEEYAEKMQSKIQTIPMLLWVDWRKYKPTRRVLKNYAQKLDKDICTVEGCGRSLLQASIVAILYSNIELLSEEKIPLTSSYEAYLEQVSSSDISRVREKIDKRVPKITFAQNQKIITMQQINQELSQQYQSVHLWDNNEKIAVYFRTAENLMAHMPQQNYQFQDYYQQPQENLRMVAHNWYKRMKY